MDRRYKPEEVVQAILEAEGVVTTAAEKLGADRSTIYNYADEFEEVKAALKTARRGLVGEMVGYLVAMGRDPEHKDHYKAVMKILTTYDTETDWTDRQQISGPDGGPIPLRWDE